MTKFITLVLLFISVNSYAVDLGREYQNIQSRAVNLAGAPADIGKRIKNLYAIYKDSENSHTFPLIALHGAIWAKKFFDRSGPIGELVSYRYFYSKSEREYRLSMLKDFSDSFKKANRQVFIDTYTNYYFSKKFGTMPGAEKFINPDLLESLNELHALQRRGIELSPRAKRSLFTKSLLFEQEISVSPQITQALARFDCPILKNLALRPIVRFKYFPHIRFFIFKDFSDSRERIAKATAAYDIAVQEGWENVERSIWHY